MRCARRTAPGSHTGGSCSATACAQVQHHRTRQCCQLLVRYTCACRLHGQWWIQSRCCTCNLTSLQTLLSPRCGCCIALFHRARPTIIMCPPVPTLRATCCMCRGLLLAHPRHVRRGPCVQERQHMRRQPAAVHAPPHHAVLARRSRAVHRRPSATLQRDAGAWSAAYTPAVVATQSQGPPRRRSTLRSCRARAATTTRWLRRAARTCATQLARPRL